MRRFMTGLFVLIILSGCSDRTSQPTATSIPSPTVTTISTITPTVTPISTNTATAILTHTPTQTSIPTPHSRDLRIVFTSNRDNNWEIYVMDSDGANPTRLTNSPADDFFPESSPGGDFILFWSYQAGPPVVASLFWIQPDDLSQGVFADNVAPYTAWSPDSTYVAYTVYNENGHEDIFAMSTGGGTSGQLTDDPARDLKPAWSPDGTTIAFVSDRDGGVSHIYLMDSFGGDQRRLTQGDMVENDPDWSPDGSMIAFWSGDDASTNIYVLDIARSNLMQLTNETSSYNENPVWSPDGTMIAFWSNRSGNSEIYTLSVVTAVLTNLTNNPAEDQVPSWIK